MKKGNINIKVQSQKLNSEDQQSNTSQKVGGGSSWLFSATLSFLKLSSLDVDVLADVTHYVGYLLFKSMGEPTFCWTSLVVQMRLVQGEFWPMNGWLWW